MTEEEMVRAVGSDRRRIYSEEVVDEAIKMYESGLMPKEIAKKTGILPGTISGFLCKKGVKAKTHCTSTDMLRAKNLHESGLSNSEIAKKIGCRPETVGNWLETMGIERKKESTRKAKLTAIDLYKSGCEASEISESLGYTRDTIYKWLRLEGIPTHRPARRVIPDEVKKACVQMFRDGHTLREVAEKYGVSIVSVREWARKEEEGNGQEL